MEKRFPEREHSVPDTVLLWCDSHRKLVGAMAVGLVMILLLAFGTGESAADARRNKAITTLIETYYADRASGDTARLEEVAHPISDTEKSFISYMSSIIDRYTGVSVLVADADAEGSWLVSAESTLDYVNQRTGVPGRETFVVRTAEDGTLYIDNAYGAFNLQNREFVTDPTLTSLIAAFEQSDAVTDQQAKVDAEYTKALEKDEVLSVFVNSTRQETIEGWQAYFQEQQLAAQEATAVTLYLQESATVRALASEEAEALGTLAKGSEVRKYSETEGWSEIAFEEGRGFVPTADLGETAPEGSVISVGDVITLTTSGGLNLRAEASTESQILDTLYPGAQIEVLGESVDGWTRVSANGYQGYVKSEFLIQ